MLKLMGNYFKLCLLFKALRGDATDVSKGQVNSIYTFAVKHISPNSIYLKCPNSLKCPTYQANRMLIAMLLK